MRHGQEHAERPRCSLQGEGGAGGPEREKTMAQLSSEYGVHANQIRQWRQRLLDELPRYFPIVAEADKEDEEWRRSFTVRSASSRWSWNGLKKSPRCFCWRKKSDDWTGSRDDTYCSSVWVAGSFRSSYYYVSKSDERYKSAFDEPDRWAVYQDALYGVRRWRRGWESGHPVNHKRVRRLMRSMGLERSIRNRGWVRPARTQEISLPAEEPGCWSSGSSLVCRRNVHPDAAWICLLVAIMDWYSRYVLAWEISTTMDAAFCITSGAISWSIQAEIFNTIRGSIYQFGVHQHLEDEGIRISMDGRGRVYDNIFVERLWRTVKYEEVYLHQYTMVSDAAKPVKILPFLQHGTYPRSTDYRTPMRSISKNHPVSTCKNGSA